ncbi:ADP-ribosylglycohydrolase family protein [Glycomyces buryatensis]|nr:ADP-ribosylglycohydrolase family protein [Glycomyces buryatensis]
MAEPVPVIGASLRRQRVRGAVVLAACADALGEPFEGRRNIDPEWVAAEVDKSAPSMRWTDDTAQMLVLATHLARHDGRIDADALAVELAAAWADEPWRGYGPGAAKMLEEIHSGDPWGEAVTSAFGGTGSLGNGAAMRVAPVGLIAGLDLDAVAETAAVSASVSHSHPQGGDGAVAQAVAVALAARGDGAHRLSPKDFIAAVTAHTATDEFAAALRAVPAMVDGPSAGIADRFACDATALGAVPASIAVFLRRPDDPVAAVAEAIGLGGDTDTIAAMAAALVGARCGEAAIPPRWGRRLEQSTRVWTVARQLAGLELHR